MGLGSEEGVFFFPNLNPPLDNIKEASDFSNHRYLIAEHMPLIGNLFGAQEKHYSPARACPLYCHSYSRPGRPGTACSQGISANGDTLCTQVPFQDSFYPRTHCPLRTPSDQNSAHSAIVHLPDRCRNWCRRRSCRLYSVVWAE